MAFGVAGLLIYLIFVSFVDLGGTVSGSVHPASILLALWWIGPMAVVWFLAKEPATAAIGGVAYLCASVVALVAVFQDEHSTAAIGLLTIPTLFYLASAALIFAEWAMTTRREHRAR